jgi:hypothetical protein
LRARFLPILRTGASKIVKKIHLFSLMP